MPPKVRIKKFEGPSTFDESSICPALGMCSVLASSGYASPLRPGACWITHPIISTTSKIVTVPGDILDGFRTDRNMIRFLYINSETRCRPCVHALNDLDRLLTKWKCRRALYIKVPSTVSYTLWKSSSRMTRLELIGRSTSSPADAR